ncbi:lipopolysaccharide biosynthesis protein [Marinifilum flexuosum]|uniref:Na+-driven multidrug efflux pump n=1 Tax=Marinifilum flexuosum TaxID=1117708 RepID=A0A419XAK8_9BACT|nr:MATE family efflux transporter [Marinifilum flexuosum]RKE04599.1 Na+-driven multidrug efflux pump [Marinifilum flexuosum]
MRETTNNKTIAKNTLFLYIRMMFTLFVSLYTSRVILDILGVNDFGIYQSVGGIVGFLSFVSSALSTGSSRFITFELGTGNKEKLRRTFSTILTVHIILALLIAIIAEISGPWFLYNKLIISPDRMDAAVFVFHVSIFTAVVSLTQVPYNASIIAHEKMSIYAYVSIFEVSAKLLIVYLLPLGGIDKLIFYAVLLCAVQIGVMLFYRIYCISNFNETRYKFIFDKTIFKEIAGFSGWSLFANASIALNSQGVLLLLNMFFSPTVVAARAISIQVNMAATQFVNNFRTAVNPQIVKQYASGNYEESKELLLSSTKYSYYLMLILSFPICLLAKPLLELWLVEVPDYTVIFLQIVIVQSLFQVFDYSFYMALYAKGRLRENALISPTISFLIFPVTYFLFQSGYSPVTLSWASLIAYAIIGVVVKPIIIIKVVDYKKKDILKVFTSCWWVSLCALPIPIICNFIFDKGTMIGFISLGMITIISVALSVFFIGLDQKIRKKIIDVISNKISLKFNI